MLYPDQQTRFSPCRTWRYFLRRPWQQQIDQSFVVSDLLDQPDTTTKRPPIAFCLLNPSTADETKDDPTVARCRRFAVAWGFGDIIVLNAFAYRATDPKDMKAHMEPVGADNDKTIIQTVEWVLSNGGQVVCGWGNHGSHLSRSTHIRSILAPYKDTDKILGFPTTKSGEPGHPLYLKNSVELMKFS